MNCKMLWALITLCCFANASATELTLNSDELIQTAEKTTALLEQKPASWTITISGDKGGSGILEFTQSGKMRRIEMSVSYGRQKIPVLTIIDRDGLWYVEEHDGISGIYRPLEAPFNFSVAYQFLFHDQLKWVNRESLPDLGTLTSQQGSLMEFSAPVPPAVVKLIEEQLSRFEEAKKQAPQLSDDPKTAAMEAKLRAALKRKVVTHVDSKTGMIVEYGYSSRVVLVSDFKFLNQADANLFSIDGRKWADHSKVLTNEELANSILVGNCAIWTPENNTQLPPDIRLLNLKTNELRRVPIRALETGTGCFLKDRSKVILSAVIGRPAGMRLIEVNLLTGVNRLIGKSFPEGAILLGSALSHDGKKLAVDRFGSGSEMLASQAYILDLGSDTATPLGEPADIAFFNWLSDDSGLILVKRHSVGLDKPSEGTICKLDLNGKYTEICPGMQPLLLADGKSMLIEDSNRAWHRCDLQGKILKDLTDGSQWHVLQSLSPSGDKVLGVKNARKGRGAEAIIFDPADGSETPLTTLPGLWIQPVGQ